MDHLKIFISLFSISVYTLTMHASAACSYFSSYLLKSIGSGCPVYPHRRTYKALSLNNRHQSCSSPIWDSHIKAGECTSQHHNGAYDGTSIIHISVCFRLQRAEQFPGSLGVCGQAMSHTAHLPYHGPRLMLYTDIQQSDLVSFKWYTMLF